MNSKFVLAALRYVGVAVAFATCGALSAALFLPLPRWPEDRDLIALALPIPFAMLCALSFMHARQAPLNLLFVPLNIVVWEVACSTAAQVWLHADVAEQFSSACVGGLIGGLGVTLSAAIGERRLLSLKYVVAGCALGGISAVPLGLWLGPHLRRARVLWLSFAIWQAAVGTFLYAIWNGAASKAQHDAAQGAGLQP